MKRILIYIFGIVLCLSCNGHLDREKTPVQTAVLLDKGAARTKASGSEFAENDSFVAYLRHVNWNGTDGERTVVEANGTPLLVTFTKGSKLCTAYTGEDITPIGTGSPLGMNSTNTRIATDITPDYPLFWDDFSEDGKGDDKNIMTPGHYLQSYTDIATMAASHRQFLYHQPGFWNGRSLTTSRLCHLFRLWTFSGALSRGLWHIHMDRRILLRNTVPSFFLSHTQCQW